MTGQVTTFYSFKGGVGRTFLLANVAWLLARWGRRVLCLDWDLEAPGLHHYLAPLAPPRPGVLDLIQALSKAHPRADWRALTEPVAGPWTGDGCLHLIRAGREDAAYLKGVQGLDWRKIAKTGFSARLEAIRAEWTEGQGAYDHVLIDSRTGITDVGGVCAAQLPDVLVLAFTATLQSLQGASRVARLASDTRAELPLERGRFRVLPVPCRIHTGEETALELEWSQRFADVMAEWSRPWLDLAVEPSEQLAHMRIREQAKWSFGERIPVAEEPLDDPNRISWSFANVAAAVDSRLERNREIIHRRKDLLTELAGEAGLGAPSPTDALQRSVFLSFPKVGIDDARALRLDLLSLNVPTNSWFDLGLGKDWSEALYRMRERSSFFVVLVPESSIGPGQTDELVHIQRLHAGGATVIPVFLGASAFKQAPPWLARVFGLTYGEPNTDWTTIAQHIARMVHR